MNNPKFTLISLALALVFFGTASAEIVLENASFEEPELQFERGSFEGWEFNSTAGTGTWPFARVDATGEPDGKQVAVIHAGGFIGQLLVDSEGALIPIEPGALYRVKFRNLPINDPELQKVNFGIYLLANSKDGVRIAEAYSFRPEMNTPGEKTIDFALSANQHESARDGTIYLFFRNFAGRMVIDQIEVERIN